MTYLENKNKTITDLIIYDDVDPETSSKRARLIVFKSSTFGIYNEFFGKQHTFPGTKGSVAIIIQLDSYVFLIHRPNIDIVQWTSRL